MKRTCSCFCLILLYCLPVFADIEVTDALGRNVKLPSPAKRIVALAPHIVENLFSAGAGDNIVGAVDYCDYPLSAKKIPRVGAISGFSLEAIVALKPDLVVVWYSGRGGQYLEKIEQLGLRTYASNPKSLEDIPKTIVDYGKLTGTSHIAEKAAEAFVSNYENLKKDYSHKREVPVLYQVWNDPLQTLNGKHIISDVIGLCGGVNVYGEEPSIAPKISVESVIERNPEVIVASGMAEERPEWLNEWRRYSSLRATALNNLYFIHPDLIQRHTVRMLLGAEQMCQHLEHARSKSPKANKI